MVIHYLKIPDLISGCWELQKITVAGCSAWSWYNNWNNFCKAISGEWREGCHVALGVEEC